MLRLSEIINPQLHCQQPTVIEKIQSKVIKCTQDHPITTTVCELQKVTMIPFQYQHSLKLVG